MGGWHKKDKPGFNRVFEKGIKKMFQKIRPYEYCLPETWERRSVKKYLTGFRRGEGERGGGASACRGFQWLKKNLKVRDQRAHSGGIPVVSGGEEKIEKNPSYVGGWSALKGQKRLQGAGLEVKKMKGRLGF